MANRHRNLFKNEGGGRIYCNVRVPNDAIADFRASKITEDDFRAHLRLDAKCGHTNRLKRRRQEYTVCDEGQTTVWAWSYRVPRRYIAGRFFFFILRAAII